MEKQHRIFVALEVKESAAERLVREEDWIGQEARVLINWLQPKDMHITLVPPWYADDNEIHEAAQALSKLDVGPFPVAITRVTIGPKKDNPRVIWAEIEPSQALALLKKEVAELLKINTDEREFRPHITMAWLEENEKSAVKDMKLDRILNLNYEAEAVLLMETVKNGSHRYEVLQKIRLA